MKTSLQKVVNFNAPNLRMSLKSANFSSKEVVCSLLIAHQRTYKF